LIRFLRLRGWKSHEDSALEFGRGSNLLVGPMGAGKTSALDAICFALFGEFPALKSNIVRLEDVVMARPDKRDRAVVEMVFDAGGETYSVTRTIDAKGGRQAVLRGGKIEESQHKRVNEAIERILGINYELFTRAIYSEQNKIDYFITLGKGERKEKMDRLLGIDRFEAARANATTAMHKLGKARENAASFLQGMGAENADREVARLEEVVCSTRSTISESERVLAGLLQKKRELEKTAEELEEAELRLRAAEKKLEGHKYALAERERDAAARRARLGFFVEKNRIAAAEEEAEREISRLKQLQKEIHELGVRAGSARAEVSFVEAERKKLGGADRRAVEEKIRELEGLAAQKKTELKKIQEEAGECLASARECENALEVLGREIAACPVCESPLPRDKHAALKKQKHEALEGIKRRLNGLTGRREALEEDAERISRDLEKQKLLLAQLRQFESLVEIGGRA